MEFVAQWQDLPNTQVHSFVCLPVFHTQIETATWMPFFHVCMQMSSA